MLLVLPQEDVRKQTLMRPEEYHDLINDPTDFLLRTFFPRSMGAFAGFQKLNRMIPFIGIPVRYIRQFGVPEIRASFQALLDAGREAMKWGEAVMDVSRACWKRRKSMVSTNKRRPRFQIILCFLDRFNRRGD